MGKGPRKDENRAAENVQRKAAKAPTSAMSDPSTTDVLTDAECATPVVAP